MQNRLPRKFSRECYVELLKYGLKRISSATKLPSPTESSRLDEHVLACDPHLLVLWLLAIGDVPVKGVNFCS